MFIIMSSEQWESLEPDFPGYFVSDAGRIRRGDQIRKLVDTPFGYLNVQLRNRYGKQQSLRVHRLVALKFLKKVEGKDFVDHVNGKRDDNRVENLRWATSQENRSNRRNGKVKMKGITKIDQFDDAGNLLKTWDSVKLIAEALLVSPAAISRACLNGTRCKGFQLKYHDTVTVQDEEWKIGTIDGTRVEVSSKGRIKGRAGKPFSGRQREDKHLIFTVGDKNYSIHRIICSVFKPRPDAEHLDVYHIDGDKRNNDISNLEWVTRSETMKRDHALRRKRKLSTLEPEQIKRRDLGDGVSIH